jgi:hypothetical protein
MKRLAATLVILMLSGCAHRDTWQDVFYCMHDVQPSKVGK